MIRKQISSSLIMLFSCEWNLCWFLYILAPPDLKKANLQKSKLPMSRLLPCSTCFDGGCGLTVILIMTKHDTTW
ncbi:hypothetical protein QBC38DRAFT_488116 [Podospora fimiseda]|uniref:Uncharacterized protein n=1 Tax=Podospora fimiseda TaxID=252190 RepID=A0AAN7BH48_9PEZI|nr:hypothetical protein QBC38DRAFT_488116 [Podospora fimiseda]